MSASSWRAEMFLITAAFLAVGLAPLRGQQFVSITGAGFTPNQLTISVGDSVLWFNYEAGASHTTTSDRPVGDLDHWDRTLNYFQSYTRSFVRAGTFTYHDRIGGFTGTIVVSGPAPLLESARRVGDEFHFNVTGLVAGKTNVLLVSTNLIQWSAIRTNVATSSSMTVTNPVAAARGFYRLVELR